MSRTCAYSLWLCHNATEKSTSYEILSSTGTSAPSGGQRVVARHGTGQYQARSTSCTHPGARMHAGPSAFTNIRPHILVRIGQTQGRALWRSYTLAHTCMPAVTSLTCPPAHAHVRVPMPTRIRCARANHDTCGRCKLARGVPVCRCSKQRLLRWQVHWRVRSARQNAAVIVGGHGR